MRSVRVRRFRPGLTTLLAAAAVIVLAPVALASHYPGNFPEFSDPYTQDTDGDCAGDAIDPINIGWKGGDGGVSNVHDLITQHAGWSTGSGSVQNLKVQDTATSYDCKNQDNQRASGSNFASSRYHTRLWFIPRTRDFADKKTVGDAHYERINLTCGHAVSTFDGARDKLLEHFADAGHAIVYDGIWGNTRTFKQCNGAYVGSGGAGYYIGAGHRH